MDAWGGRSVLDWIDFDDSSIRSQFSVTIIIYNDVPILKHPWHVLFYYFTRTIIPDDFFRVLVQYSH